jgi:hypothetical protein
MLQGKVLCKSVMMRLGAETHTCNTSREMRNIV